jgi:hypothetical protein
LQESPKGNNRPGRQSPEHRIGRSYNQKEVILVVMAMQHISEKKVDVANEEHDCSNFTVLDGETQEMICIRCGRVDEEGMVKYLHEMGADEGNGRALTHDSHNVGNALFSSQTVQSGYVSRANVGLAMSLNAPRGKDAQGKKIKPQLRNPYESGLVADPSRGCHTKEDILTGKTSIEFSRYDRPTLQVIMERAVKRSIEYRLDIVEQAKMAKELRRIYSNLFLGPMLDYPVLVALLTSGQPFSKAQRRELEKELALCIEDIRNKITSGCATKGHL